MTVPDRARPTSRFVQALLFPACSLLLVACAAGAGVASSPPVSSMGPGSSAGASADPGPTPIGTDDAVPAGVPTACYGLGEGDCRRIGAHVATMLTPEEAAVRYAQIGPFGCRGGERCPTTLAARPEGDITLEVAGGALSFHVKVISGLLDAQRQEAFGISLPPTTRPPLPSAAQPFSLGHCGLWSGVDLGGSWWDPVGFVDSDHGDSINAAEGTIAQVGPDQAVFTSKAGLVVQLVRRDGEKFLPFCD